MLVDRSAQGFSLSLLPNAQTHKPQGIIDSNMLGWVMEVRLSGLESVKMMETTLQRLVDHHRGVGSCLGPASANILTTA